MTSDAAIPMRRTLRVMNVADGPSAAELVRQMPGVDSAEFAGAALKVDYDLRRVTLAEIEAQLARSGVALKGGLQRLRRALWRFEERNERENAAHPATGACCNRPPPRG